jgi:MoxR-like ATPase
LRLGHSDVCLRLQSRPRHTLQRGRNAARAAKPHRVQGRGPALDGLRRLRRIIEGARLALTPRSTQRSPIARRGLTPKRLFERLIPILSAENTTQMTDSDRNAAIDESIEKLNKAYNAIRDQMGKVIVGQSEVIDQLLISLFSRGHCLLEGVPGLAKTLMISTLARCLSMTFSRIQFTPDLMPSDITGTDVLQENRSTGTREFRFIQGPLFHNFVLADEINRTPPKTQAALLEAMQERQVTVGQMRHILADPFFVLATQNPIEQEGTYALPEAQQDRFMFKVFVRYPTFAEERQIAKQTTGIDVDEVRTVLNTTEVLGLQRIVRQVPVTDHVVNYALALVRQTRVGEEGTPDFVQEWLRWGAGPRAVQYLLLGGKARALLNGRTYVSTDDVASLAAPVLRHRVVTNFSAESEGVTPDRVIERLVESTPAKEGDLTSDPRLRKIFAA